MIAASGLTRRFGTLTAVDGLDLQVDKGEVFGFLGPNGAGKTTTVRMLAALIAPSSGTARIGGCTLGSDNRRIRQQVGVLTETPGLYRRLSAWDNLMFFARLHRLDDPERQVERYLRMFELWERRSDRVGGFSKGMRQKLALARALLHEPRVLFLDEPTAGLDPEAARLVRDLVASLRSDERTTFLCTHNLDEADRLCDRVALFNGRLVALGTPAELKEQMYGRRTVIHFAEPPRGIEARLELPFVESAEWVDDALVLGLSDPDRENPIVVRRLVELGAEIRYVNALRVSLEDLYLDLMEAADA